MINDTVENDLMSREDTDVCCGRKISSLDSFSTVCEEGLKADTELQEMERGLFSNTVILETPEKLIMMPTNELDGQKRNKRAPLL